MPTARRWKRWRPKTAGRYEQLVCLGDVVGYGADPAFAIDWLREQPSRPEDHVRGNHDKAAIGLAESGMVQCGGAEVGDCGRSTRAEHGRLNSEGLRCVAAGAGAGGESFGYATARRSTRMSIFRTRADVQAFFGSDGAVTMPAALFFLAIRMSRAAFSARAEDAGPGMRMLPPVGR